MIATRHLTLVPSNPALAQLELRSASELAARLGVTLPPSWPPELYDEEAVRRWLAMYLSDPQHVGWGAYYFVLRGTERNVGVLVGAGGYKGKPLQDGTVEIGYAMVPDFQRRGLATEAAGGLVRSAFLDPRVTRVIAETYPHLSASIAVLERNGFRLIGDGSEPGTIRFGLDRPEPAIARP